MSISMCEKDGVPSVITMCSASAASTTRSESLKRPEAATRVQQLLRPGLVERHAGLADGLQTVRVVVHAQHGEPAVGERQCERQTHATQPDDRNVQRHQTPCRVAAAGLRTPARTGGSARTGGRIRR